LTFDFFVGDFEGDLTGVLLAVCFLAGLVFGVDGALTGAFLAGLLFVVDGALTGVFLTGLAPTFAFDGDFVGVMGNAFAGDFVGVLGAVTFFGVFTGEVICARPKSTHAKCKHTKIVP
jgi:hypothetical protein